MPSRLRRFLRIATLPILLLGLLPGVAHAVSISAPSVVEMPDSFDFVVTGSNNHVLAIYEDGADQAQFACYVSDGSCTFTANFGYVSTDTLTRTYRVVESGGGSASTTVTFVQPTWQLDLKATKNDIWEDDSAVLMPAAAQLSATITPKKWSPYRIRIFDADTGADTGINCATDDATCTGTTDSGFRDGLDVSKQYVAKMMDGSTWLSSKPTSTASVNFYMPDFGLSMDGPTFVAPNSEFHLTVKNSFNDWSSLRITVRDANGNALGGCWLNDNPCSLSAWSGATGWSQSYTATITDGPNVVARTSPVPVMAVDPATVTTLQGISLAGLAAAYGSARAICDAILTLPGTHNADSSATDQWLACDTAAQAGESGEASLRAIVATLVGGVGLASYFGVLSHHAPPPTTGTNPCTSNCPPPGDPGSPTHPGTVTPTPPPGTDSSLFNGLVAHLTNGSAAIRDAVDTEAASKIATQCMNAVEAAGMAPTTCKSESIFMPGSDVAVVTQHRRDAIYGGNGEPGYPNWTQLTRRDGPRDGWYLRQPECQANPDTVLLACDEYPYNKVVQGGSNGAANFHRPSLRVLSRARNSEEGSWYGAFVTACQVAVGENFVVLPSPPELNIPTTRVCKP